LLLFLRLPSTFLAAIVPYSALIFTIFSRTSSQGKLAFLNNMVGVFESEIDADGNFSEKI
jgi:hypothetical protein